MSGVSTGLITLGVVRVDFSPHIYNRWPNDYRGGLGIAGKSERKGNALFNDALNTFYIRLLGVRHMVKDHSDSEKGNQLPPHRLLFTINSKGYFICNIPPVVERWLEREIAQWTHPMKDRSDDPSHHERTLLPRSYISLPGKSMSQVRVIVGTYVFPSNSVWAWMHFL